MRTLLGLAAVAAFLGLGTRYCFESNLLPDDSGFVALRVAENFRSGQGLIFNAGERRDLIDSPLWVALLSVVAFADFAPLLVQVLGLLLGVASLLVMLGCMRTPLLGAAAALLVAFDGLFASRAVAGGSEVLAALYLVLLYPILRGARGRGVGLTDADKGLAVWVAVAVIVRYELVIVALPVALGAGLREARRLQAWVPLVAGLASAGVVLALRWHYFGALPAYWEPWPPTQASVGAAVSELFAIVLRRPLLLLGIGVLVAECLRGRLWIGRRIGLALGMCGLVLFSFAPAAGADVERQVAAALPLAYVLAVEAVWIRARTRFGLVAALLLLVAQPGWMWGARQADGARAVAYVRIGRWLNTHALPGTVVGAERVGALGYYSRMKMEDVAGRVSPRVAHTRRVLDAGALGGLDFQPMLHQEPDIVLVVPGDPVPPASIYVPADDAMPAAIRGPYRVYRWAGSPVWREAPPPNTDEPLTDRGW